MSRPDQFVPQPRPPSDHTVEPEHARIPRARPARA